MKKVLVFLLVTCMIIASFSYSLVAADDTEVYSPAAIITQLQYSTFHKWESSMSNYNCYAYAIGRTSQAYDPGNFSDGSYNMSGNIDELANLVKADLLGDLGFVCVKVTSTRPEYDPGWVNIIAVRKDTNGPFGVNDYHVAKLTDDGWYHKPGTTSVLKFKNPPTNNTPWTNEYIYNNTAYSGNITYESQLRYLLYKMYHSATLSEVWTEEHYHSGTRHYYQYDKICNDCGEVESTIWKSLPCTGDCVTPWGTEIDSEIS